MSGVDDGKRVGRRGFLGALAGLSAASVAAAATVMPSRAMADESGEERVKARYQETDHVRAYYATNRYETKQS